MQVDARYSFGSSFVTRDQYNIYNTAQPASAPSLRSPQFQHLSFNDSPNILSIHRYIGRDEELDEVERILNTLRGALPARCALYGMPGVGKTQFALQYATRAYVRQRYSMVFWITATTIERLNQGFAKILTLVGHEDRDHTDQSTRLTAARRWLEETEVSWLLVLDSVERESVGFLRENLPRKNALGSILFTTRTEFVADEVINAFGRKHVKFELNVPHSRASAELLLAEAELEGDEELMGPAEEVVKCVACLPLAVAQAASFMRQSGKSPQDLLDLYGSKHKLKVSINVGFCIINSDKGYCHR